MPVQLIVNKATGERGYQARAAWQTPAGSTRYFSCRQYGPRNARALAERAARTLERQARRRSAA
ncbi:MAG: hypothetical protein KIT60_06865 [Burkholderiaceae bacterium]|nr:hypothetical protein [Burkholderiaceae bacterium]